MRLRILLIVALFLLVALLAFWTSEDNGKAEEKGLQGDWKLVVAVQNGRPAPVAGLNLVLTIEGNTFTQKVNGMVIAKSRFTVDPISNPKTIDDTGTAGPNKDKTSLSIYELRGDELRVCTAQPGARRPTEFSSRAGTGHSLETFRRVKP